MINFKDPQLRYLIDYANMKQGLIKFQKNFLRPSQIESFLKNDYLGMPLVLPIGIKYFKNNKKNIYKIKKKLILKYIFKTKKIDYVGIKIFFKFGNKFSYDVELKKNINLILDI